MNLYGAKIELGQAWKHYGANINYIISSFKPHLKRPAVFYCSLTDPDEEHLFGYINTDGIIQGLWTGWTLVDINVCIQDCCRAK